MADYGNSNHNTQLHRSDGSSLGGILVVLGVVALLVVLVFAFTGGGTDAPDAGAETAPLIESAPTDDAAPAAPSGN